MNSNSEHSNPLVAFVGMPGSGKSAAVHYLSKKGWQVVHFGAITIDEIKMRGVIVNEANEREVREELRTTHGMAAYAKLSLARIKHALSVGPTVIDGLYSWSEYKFLKQQLHNRMYVIAVSAPRHIRYERLSRRRTRPLSYKEAEMRDFAEIENLEKGGPIAMADYTVQNGGTKSELLSTLERLLSTLISHTTCGRKIAGKGTGE